MNVAILGASQAPDRYSHMAQKNLMEAGYRVTPVTPKYPEVLGIPAVDSVTQIAEEVDTLTVYLEPNKTKKIIDAILQLHPRRVIFNPGTESPEIEATLQKAGIETEQACTLVLLRTGQFEN